MSISAENNNLPDVQPPDLEKKLPLYIVPLNIQIFILWYSD